MQPTRPLHQRWFVNPQSRSFAYGSDAHAIFKTVQVGGYPEARKLRPAESRPLKLSQHRLALRHRAAHASTPVNLEGACLQSVFTIRHSAML
jgi:hypothetical protein